MASQAQREENRLRLVNGALDLIAEKPFASVTVEELAERSGVSYWSTYRNLPTREQIFRMAATHLARRILDAMRAGGEPTSGVLAATQDFARRLMAVMQGEDYFRLLAIVIREGRGSDWLADVYSEQVATPLVRLLEHIVRAAGESLGAVVLIRDGAAQRFLMQMESALVLPRLHPMSHGPDHGAATGLVDAAARALVAATYAHDWQSAA
ncbi:TetR/AcrR family transcriptional regulator [Allosphingosinicella indica]|uniref:Transcriptional regulator, TetR family n=1 Tax=Allosphingosinicella indica TaxID=941907 RepID=A0A1X7G2A3_9SPHN|nr:TetR/AcrR family transcriptional regulator [Allosphingosinicella indica]SMF62028.1 transcriptional regulator, TetR family [Allosphingosinicella indica]